MDEYLQLVIAVYRQAFKDYRAAMEKGNERRIREIERFFRRNPFLLSLDADYLVQTARNMKPKRNSNMMPRGYRNGNKKKH